MTLAKGKIALVSGAGGPMGTALVDRLLREGVDGLALTDISQGRLDAICDKVRDGFPKVALTALRADITNQEEASTFCDNALADLGSIDLLINLVGGIRSRQLYTPFLKMTVEQWKSTFDLNLLGGFHLIQKIAPEMLENGFGRIINITSIVLDGEKGQSDYAAAKAAVASFSRSLAAEFAPHVTVNCVAPGLTRTSVTEDMPQQEVERLTGLSFNKRMAEPEEVADAVLYFLSDGARFVTGETLAVSGGIHPHL